MGVRENLIVAGLVAVPVAIGVAILNRLYEIDLVIRKTVVYVVPTPTLARCFGTRPLPAAERQNSWSDPAFDNPRVTVIDRCCQ
jgi:hypothetical protein